MYQLFGSGFGGIYECSGATNICRKHLHLKYYIMDHIYTIQYSKYDNSLQRKEKEREKRKEKREKDYLKERKKRKSDRKAKTLYKHLQFFLCIYVNIRIPYM